MTKKVFHVAIFSALLFMVHNAGASGTDSPADLLSAVRAGDAAAIEQLLAAGTSPNAQIQGGVTALIAASFEGNTNIVKLLLEKGADVSRKTDQGMTALMIAAAKGHNEVVKMLLAKGADPNVQEASGFNAFQMATAAGHQATADLLKGQTKITAQLVTKTVVGKLDKSQKCLPVMNFPDEELKKLKCLHEGEEVIPTDVFTNNNWTLIRKPVPGWVPTDKLTQVVAAQEQGKPAAKQSTSNERNNEPFSERVTPSSSGRSGESDDSPSMPSSGGGEWWRRR